VSIRPDAQVDSVAVAGLSVRRRFLLLLYATAVVYFLYAQRNYVLCARSCFGLGVVVAMGTNFRNVQAQRPSCFFDWFNGAVVGSC
jgi:hypothetical protein